MHKDNSLRSKMISLVIPIAFQQLMLALVSASDAVMLGFVNQNAMAAVSLAGQYTFVYGLFMAALTIGCSMFTAQYWGKRDTAMLERILGYVLRFSIIISLCFMIAALLFPTQIMTILTNEVELIRDGSAYLRMVAPSYLLMGISQIYLCMMKNCQKAFDSTLISTVTVLLNIICNAILIFGVGKIPALGLYGAAIATVFARVVEAIWAVIFLNTRLGIPLSRQTFFHTKGNFGHVFWKYTRPVLANELVWGCGFSMCSVIMGHLGADAVAANSIANITKNLIICFSLGLSAGGGIIIGNELGAGQIRQAEENGKKLLVLAVWSGIGSGILVLLSIPFILGMVNLTATAQNDLKWMLLISAYYLIGKSINSMTVGGIFPAGGDSRFGFICDTVTLWCIVIPISCVAAFVFKLPVLAVYFLLNLDEIIKLPVVIKHFHKHKWVKDLTEEAGK